MTTEYYKINSGRLSFGEYWRMSPNPVVFLIAAGAKLFGGLPMNFSIPRVDTLHTIDWEDMPPRAGKRMEPSIDTYESLGYKYGFCYEMPILELDRFFGACTLLGEDGLRFAMVVYVETPEEKRLTLGIVTEFTDGNYGVTTTAKKELEPEPNHRVHRHLSATAEELHQLHEQHLEEWRNDGLEPVKQSWDRLPQVILAAEQATVDFHASRGVFVPMSEAEVRKLRDKYDDEYE